MKFSIRKSMLLKFVKFLKWSKIAAKLAAVGTTMTGALASLSGSATTGIALSAAGASTYAATDLQTKGYEKTKHIPPGRVDKAANILRRQEMGKARKPASQSKGARSGFQPVKHTPVRSASGAAFTHLPRKK